MQDQAPTVLMYGTPPEDGRLLKEVIAPRGWGLVQDNGRARDAVFTVYENLARADAILALPDAHPLHLVTLLAEAEVGHPLIVQSRTADLNDFKVKPIIFFGSTEEWLPFRNMFGVMQQQGLLREGFDRLAHYEASPIAARAWIEAHLPEEIRTTRIDYYLHTRKQADLSHEARKDVRPPSPITISCFGSASTANPAHLEHADEAARAFTRNNWNILHGGGDYGVMGQLTRSALKFKAYTIGVTVHASGAPKIGFERNGLETRGDQIDELIASKDMLHRIESYAGNAQAFVALDGGIGSVQEVLVIAELLARRHPAVIYETAVQKLAAKPLWVLDADGIYAPVLKYLALEYGYLLEHIRVTHSIDHLEAELGRHFVDCPPHPRSDGGKPKFRELYGDRAQPVAAVRK
jgi:predicted Rossmann-fold nucleotide-binding protein